MLQRTREHLALILIGLLPLHALFVTVGTRLLTGPGHAPLTTLALWKEIVLFAILGMAAVEWTQQKEKHRKIRLDRLDICILILLGLSVFVTALTHGDWRLYLFGFKYDFVPLIVFLILRRVPWSEWFSNTAITVIVALGGVVALYGLATLALPMSFFRALGYSDLHSLYLPGSPLAAFQQVGGAGIRRIQSTFSGPNQLGLWLILPWSFCIVRFFSNWFRVEHPLLHPGPEDEERRMCGFYGSFLIIIGLAILFTFSRTAWLAALVVAVIFIVKTMPERRVGKHLLRLFGVGVMLLILVTIVAPTTVVRLTSSRDHIIKPLIAMNSIAQHQFGQGLGTAGPASNRVSDPCVFLEEGSDASWAADRPSLCVFVGSNQVQPPGRACNCPYVTENWYLQMGVEMGVIGFAVYLALIIFILLRLASFSTIFLPFLGISIAGLLLHAWEGSAVAYTLWILTAVQIGKRGE